MKKAARHNVYVIELDPAVLKSRKFREDNRHYRGEKACLYVGMTGRTPEKRFEQHKKGHKASRTVKKHGIRLRPRLFRSKNPMTYEDACAMEIELARRLRKRGYAVWQN